MEEFTSIEEFKQDYIERIKVTLGKGRTSRLYWDLYVPVDAQMEFVDEIAGLDLRVLNDFTIDGWEVESIVPRTYGGTQSYKINRTNAYGWKTFSKQTMKTGLGGHVIGVYVLLKLDLTLENFADFEEVIGAVAEMNLPDNLVDEE